jgi:hypothetical protein
MGEIKSAAEIAKEKLAKIGEPTEEERLKWKYGPAGEKLAARYLKENTNLVNEIKSFGEKASLYITASINDVLVRNILLPRNEADRRINKKAMDGIKLLKNEKVAVENTFSKMRHVLDHFVQEGTKQKKQAYDSLKTEFEAKLKQVIRQKTGVDASVNIDVEKQPQFLEEWQRLQAQMDAQYLTLLDEYKNELGKIN